MNLSEGTLLQGGKYRIVRFISSGGFGCTYEAEHVMLQKRVAIKEFFAKDFCNRDGATSRVTVGTESKAPLVNKLRCKFIDEARALSKLEHPHIVRVSDVFEENGTAYYVMDYIDGRSLGDISNEQGAIPEYKAVKYIRQTAEALKYVHNHHMLHLDIKPSNIMIDEQDNAVLIDFGASKQYDEESGENTSTLMGKTPGYAPLEQMGNDVVQFHAATDIYSLGATLYKLLTGNTPLSANRLASGEQLRPLPDAISKNVRDAVNAAMRSIKAERPQNIDEFLNILNGNEDEGEDTIIDNPGTHPGPGPVPPHKPKTVPPHKPKPYKGIAAAIVLLVIVSAVIGIYTHKTSFATTEEETPQDTTAIVTNQEMNYQGNTYRYTGPVNDAGNADGDGEGVYTTGTYTGSYVDGCREGKGKFVTSNVENTFEGTFKNDMYDEGTLTLDDGSYYKGTFKNNNFYTGTWYTASGKYDGEMQNGQYK